MADTGLAAAAQRYREHLAAMSANKPNKSPYRSHCPGSGIMFWSKQWQADEALLARAYVERDPAAVRSAFRKSIQQAADCIHNATQWNQRDLERELGYSPMEKLLDELVAISRGEDPTP